MGFPPKPVHNLADFITRAQAAQKAADRAISDPFPTSHVATHWRPTPELRLLRIEPTATERERPMRLQQRWVSDDGKSFLWRDVPTVTE